MWYIVVEILDDGVHFLCVCRVRIAPRRFYVYVFFFSASVALFFQGARCKRESS